MNWNIVEGKWKQFRGKLKARWGKLSDDQLDVIDGMSTIFTGKVHEAYGITKDAADHRIKRAEGSSNY